jgi:hypothetical protein
MKRLYHSILFIFLAVIAFNCQKEVSYSGSSETYTSLDQFFEKNQKAPQTFSANSSNAITLQTNKGTRILFQPNSFVTLNNQPVTGDVSIEVKEILTPAEMILSRALPVSNGQPLESAGEFLVKVTKNGQELKLGPGNLMEIKLPSLGVNMNNMQVFNGTAVSTDAGSKINWTVNANPGNTVFVDSASFGKTLFADSINWINCDRFINEPRINYTVYPGNTTGFDSVAVMVHFTGRNSVVPMPWNLLTTRFYSQSMIAANATVVGIGIKDNKLQAAIVPVNLVNAQSMTLSFSPFTEAQLKERLAQLH